MPVLPATSSARTARRRRGSPGTRSRDGRTDSDPSAPCRRAAGRRWTGHVTRPWSTDRESASPKNQSVSMFERRSLMSRKCTVSAASIRPNPSVRTNCTATTTGNHSSSVTPRRRGRKQGERHEQDRQGQKEMRHVGQHRHHRQHFGREEHFLDQVAVGEQRIGGFRKSRREPRPRQQSAEEKQGVVVDAFEAGPAARRRRRRCTPAGAAAGWRTTRRSPAPIPGTALSARARPASGSERDTRNSRRRLVSMHVDQDDSHVVRPPLRIGPAHQLAADVAGRSIGLQHGGDPGVGNH